MGQITRRTALTMAAGTVTASTVVNTATATADTPAPGRPVASGANPALRTALITRVTPRNNWRVTAVAIRYANPINMRGGIIPPSAFRVTAAPGGQSAARTVTRVYPNTEARTDDLPHAGRRGRYLIIELDPDDANAQASRTDPLPLHRAYAVRQVADVTTPHGELVLAAGPLAIRNDDVITPVVDGFTAGSFTDSTGFELAFRLHQPEAFVRSPAAATRYPLVITLHGGGEVADNNMTQLTANRVAVTFAKPERQRRHPAFVLAPQIPLPRPMDGPDATDWTDPKVRAALVELIDTFTTQRPVDADRLYLVGLSSGARGIFNLLPRHPHTFAAALATAGWGDPSTMGKITHIPIWADHSIDDPVVPYREGRFGKPGTWTLMNEMESAGAQVTRGEWANDLPKAEFEARSRALLKRARQAGSHVLFTSYTPGTTPVSPHFAWAQTYENDVVIDWLFNQSR
ncbi:PHB depolymerase family esterase [Streptomyces sp. Rer75]|uniref:PHB depolymerase family esterase n=1 Tax=Streptomyces sp. Rer75 TaxID=2750011 RepID=UPI0015CFD4DC|nr:PHB depolymerase family esterase [Streptomyces sp. Rer75]QLH19406.1 phospholipase [Streptomyces sp. Rer75]